MRHLAQQSYYDNFYGNQGQFNTLKQKYKTQLCKHYLEQQKCPLAQYCQFAHGQDDLRQPNDVSSSPLSTYYLNNTVIDLYFLLASPKKFRKNCSRRSPLQLQNHPMQVLAQRRGMQIWWCLLVLPRWKWEEKADRSSSQLARGCYSSSNARKAEEGPLQWVQEQQLPL